VCLQSSPPETGYCFKLCETSLDCPEGEECFDAHAYVLPAETCGGSVDQPYRFCHAP
jgi:hypothetical protein